MDIKNITTEQVFHIATDWNRREVKGNIVEFNIDMGEHVFFIHKNMDPFGKGYRVSELTTGLAITTEEALTKAKAKRIAEERLPQKFPEYVRNGKTVMHIDGITIEYVFNSYVFAGVKYIEGGQVIAPEYLRPATKYEYINYLQMLNDQT